MPEIERSRDKNTGDKKTHSTPPESEKNQAKDTPKENTAKTTPPKSVWDMPDGEFTEVIDSEGHRNRINYY